MNFHKTKNSQKLDKKAYIFSLIGLFIFFILWAMADGISCYYKSKISQTSLKQALYKNNYDKAREISLENKEKNFILELAKKFIPYIKSNSSNINETTIQNIFDLQRALKNNNLEELLKISKNINDQLKKSKKISKTIKNLSKDIYKNIKELKLESENNKKYSTNISELKAKKIRIKRRHTLVADEFANFLSLEPNYKKGTELKVYTSGVLYGLPVLKDLKDGIESLPELKDELDNLKGKVEIQAPNAYEIFTARILSLREASIKIRNEYKENMANLKYSKKELNISKSQIDSLKSKIVEKINDLIIKANS